MVAVTTVYKREDTLALAAGGPMLPCGKRVASRAMGLLSMEERKNNRQHQVVEGPAGNRCEKGSKIMHK